MNMKTLLNEINDLKREIKALENKKHELRIAMLPSGVSYDWGRVKISHEDKMVKYAIKIETVNKIQTEKALRLYDCLVLLEDVLCLMPTSRCRLLLDLKYKDVNNVTSWKDVAKTLNLNECYTRHELYNHTIKEAEEALKELKDTKAYTRISEEK